MRIVFEKDRTGPDHLTVHTDKEIWFVGFINASSDNYADNASEHTQLAYRIAAAEGIEWAEFHRYYVVLKKGRCFRWSDIVDEVVRRLKAMCLGDADAEAVVETADGMSL